MKKIITEVCAETVNSAIAAEAGGADRIELCQALSEGGLTPSPALTKWCCENLKLEVMVLIRPRPGDFMYNETEFEIILEDILFCREEWWFRGLYRRQLLYLRLEQFLRQN